MPAQQQWLAFTVSGYKTQAVGQTNGYTILFQPDSPADEPTRLGSEHRTQHDSEGQQTVDSRNDEDLEMPDSDLQTGIQDLVASTLPRSGFQRYLCAEYVDSLA